jgi:hypothetical protein
MTSQLDNGTFLTRADTRIYYYYYYLIELQMGSYPVAVDLQ